jgi:hypothetical protein
MSILESYRYFMGLPKWDKDNKNSINGLKINGNSVSRLHTISWIGGNIRSVKWFQEWINKVFAGQDIIFK